MRLRQIKKVTFSSLRPDYSTGAYRELDEEITRICRCVRTDVGLKWQIVKKKNQHEWDYFLETDQQCLDDLAMQHDYNRYLLAGLPNDFNGISRLNYEI